MIDQTSRWFNEDNPNWSPDDDVNAAFLQINQDLANQKLRTRGHLLLNEVYEALGFEASAPASVFGWSQQVNNDTFVEFDFIRMEAGFAIDFNVDGVVFHEIGRKP